MQKETEFIRSMTEKLKIQGDVTQNEATRIFILAMIMYTYEMGEVFENQRWRDFHGKFDYTEASEALDEWYKEVFSRIPNYRQMDKYYNFVASIPSPLLCPPTKVKADIVVSSEKHIVPAEKEYSLEKYFGTIDHLLPREFRFNNKMKKWIKDNTPLSFDVIHCTIDIEFARFGLLGSLPIYEREIEIKKADKLMQLNIPFLQTRVDTSQKNCSTICPVEYKNILDALADDLPIPEIPQGKVEVRIPKDIAYINSLTARLPYQDITEEEADNIYLLLKAYQAVRVIVLDSGRYSQEEMERAVKPGLDALSSWYRAIRKELKRGRRGNFIYTLPNNLDMNLYQLRKPIKACLEMLPKEPTKVRTRYKDRFPIKKVFLDTKFVKETGVSDEYAQYRSSRYGFFKRNGIDLKEWKPILQCEKKEDILDGYFSRTPLLGKLYFAERSLGIKQIVIEDMVAVKEEDYPKMLEVLKLPDIKIMNIAQLLGQRELEEIRAEKERLAKTPENYKKLDVLERKESILKRTVVIEHVIKATEMVYEAQKAQEEYLEDGSWMEIDR